MLAYPCVLFRTDFAAGMKMTIGQAARHRRLQSGRAWPDLFIAQPAFNRAAKEPDDTVFFHGLFIELKATNIYKKDGSLRANPHVAEQAAMLERLRKLGYEARFAVGFDQAKQIIDDYLHGH